MLAALSSTEPGSSSNSSSATSLAEQVASQLGLVVLLAPVATAKSVSRWAPPPRVPPSSSLPLELPLR